MSGLSATHNANFLTITLLGLFSSEKQILHYILNFAFNCEMIKQQNQI